jgi:hypothetical protein
MVIEKAKTLGLMLRGTLFADSMWRISNSLREIITKKS